MTRHDITMHTDGKGATRCYFSACSRPVTHYVQRLWVLPGSAPFALEASCARHRPKTTRFYNVRPIAQK